MVSIDTDAPPCLEYKFADESGYLKSQSMAIGVGIMLHSVLVPSRMLETTTSVVGSFPSFDRHN